MVNNKNKIMKRLLIFILLLYPIILSAQTVRPVVWDIGYWVSTYSTWSTITITDSLVLDYLATPNTTVLSPTSTGMVDTLETTDLATADITATGLWTFDNVVIDSLDVDSVDADYIYVDKLTDGTFTSEAGSFTGVNNFTVDSIDANYTDTDTLLVNNTAEVSGMLTVVGTITGGTLVALHTAAAVIFSDLDSCKNVAHFNNDADVIDFTLPGAAAGLVVMFYDIGGGVITVDPVDGEDTIYLNGTSVGAGDAIDSPGAVGDFICLMAIDTTRWVTVGRSGVWIDGGAD